MSLLDRLLLNETPYTGPSYTDFRAKYFYHCETPQWLTFLPWNKTIEEGERYGFIPKTGRGVVYEGPRSLVGITPQTAIDSLMTMEKDIGKQLELYDLSPEIISGFSIGTFPASYFSRLCSPRTLVLVAPGARLGENIWAAPLTQWVKQEAITRGFPDAETYDEIMKGMNPIDCSAYFPEDTHIVYGTRDAISPPNNVEKLIGSMKTSPRITRLPFGHVGTLLVSPYLLPSNT